MFGVVEAAAVVVVAGAPPGTAHPPDAGDMAVRVGLPDEAGEGPAVVRGREPGVVLVRQTRHRRSSFNCTRDRPVMDALASCAYKWDLAVEWVFGRLRREVSTMWTRMIGAPQLKAQERSSRLYVRESVRVASLCNPLGSRLSKKLFELDSVLDIVASSSNPD